MCIRDSSDPELKRKAIGKTFIDVFDREASSIKDAKETQLSMTREEIRAFLYAQPPEALMKAMNDAGPKRDGMTRVFPDGLVILQGGIKEAFINGFFATST